MTGIEIMMAAGLALAAAGTAAAAHQQGRQAQAQSAQMQRQADMEHAASQQEAQRIREETEGVVARQQQLAAAGGGGTSDPSILKLTSDAAIEGETQAQQTSALGQMRAADLRANAENTRQAGRAAQYGGYLTAAGQLAGGGSRLYSSMNPTTPAGYNTPRSPGWRYGGGYG